MDLSLIKNKLKTIQSKGEKREKVDYSKIFWKPKPGKHQIRIVPSKFNKSTPFREIYLHYGYSKAPILALSNWGEADPIVEAAAKLRKSDNPDHWQMAKKISPKMRVFAPVVVRGEEDMGVRLWEFGKEIYTQLMGIAMNEDYGDYTDVHDGRDFTIEATEDVIMGRKGIKCTITPRVKTSQLSKDNEEVQKWLEEQPDILSINKHFTYEDLSDVFQKWVNPEEEEGGDESEGDEAEDEAEEEVANQAEVLPWDKRVPDKPASKKAQVASTPPVVKQSKADKFNDLFSE